MGLLDIPDPYRVPILERLARDGDDYAMYALSLALPRGEDGKETPAAVRWRRRAERTLLKAQVARVSSIPRRRWATHAPTGSVLTWARRAARLRHPEGLHAVAWTLRGARRRREALVRAARAGSSHAAFDLAMHVETFAGDPEEVRRWLRFGLVLGGREEWFEDLESFRGRARPFLARFAAAPAEFRRRAAAKDPDAQVHLGYARAFGCAEPHDPRGAQAAFERGARAGSSEAAIALALLFWHPAMDVVYESIQGWAATAASSGDPLGLYLASEWSAMDTLLEQRRADRWLRRAALAGEPRAAVKLAQAFRWGRWVRKDWARAEHWARVAARAGHEGAMWELAMILEEKPRRSSRDRREATEWRRRAASVGNHADMSSWGVHLHEGRGVRRNDREAVRWYRRAAAQGCPHATANLGRCYRRGHGVRKSPRLAVRWFRRAAEVFDSAQAAGCLGDMYRKGESGRPDVKQAFLWYRRAAAMGDAEGLSELGAAYHSGRGVTRDREFAAELYRAAAAAGDGWGAYFLGLCYRDGEGARRSRRSAERWFRVAIERGVKPAKQALVRLRAAGQQRARP